MGLIREITNIHEIRKIFNKVKTIKKTIESSLFLEVLGALSAVSEYEIQELIPDVYELLESEDNMVRQEVVATLGFSTRLQIPEFRDQAYEIWLNDSSEDVRETALGAWIGYYMHKKDPKVIAILYKILCDESKSIYARCLAMSGILKVSNEPFSFIDICDTKRKLYHSETHEELNQKIEWEEVAAVVKKYAPQTFS